MGRVKLRLIAAISFSGLIHLSLLLGLKPQPTRSIGGSTGALQARLQVRAEIPSAPTPVVVAPTQPAAAREEEKPPKEPMQSAAPEAPVAEARPPEPDPALALPFVSDPRFYPARELDVFPKPLHPVEPAYPAPATQAQLSGSVTLELLIDETGAVQDAQVLSATPEGYFEEAALRSFRAARFLPAQKDGVAVRAKMVIQVDFNFDPEAAQRLTRAVR